MSIEITFRCLVTILIIAYRIPLCMKGKWVILGSLHIDEMPVKFCKYF